jgi:hypothetical protein
VKLVWLVSLLIFSALIPTARLKISFLLHREHTAPPLRQIGYYCSWNGLMYVYFEKLYETCNRILWSKCRYLNDKVLCATYNKRGDLKSVTEVVTLLTADMILLCTKSLYLIHESLSSFHRKMYIRLLVRCYLCPI